MVLSGVCSFSLNITLSCFEDITNNILRKHQESRDCHFRVNSIAHALKLKQLQCLRPVAKGRPCHSCWGSCHYTWWHVTPAGVAVTKPEDMSLLMGWLSLNLVTYPSCWGVCHYTSWHVTPAGMTVTTPVDMPLQLEWLSLHLVTRHSCWGGCHYTLWHVNPAGMTVTMLGDMSLLLKCHSILCTLLCSPVTPYYSVTPYYAHLCSHVTSTI